MRHLGGAAGAAGVPPGGGVRLSLPTIANAGSATGASLACVLAATAAFTATPAFSAGEAEGPGFWKFSCYAYRDENRNGVYDLGDRPFAGLVLALRGPDGAEAVRFSNSGGFANFTTSRENRDDIDVPAAGSYLVVADRPPGLSVTSGDGQVLRFVDSPAVPGGLTVAETCLPVGVAPDLVVKGRVALSAGMAAEAVEVVLHQSGGGSRPVPLRPDGGFDYVAEPGEQVLSVRAKAGGSTVVRRFQVAGQPVLLSQIDPIAPPVDAVRRIPVVVGFDDLVAPPGILEVPAGYGGLAWRNWIAVHKQFYEGPGYVNGVRSGEFVAYNSSGAPAEISSGHLFDFLGAHVAVAWPRGAEGDVMVRGWSGGTLVYEERLRLSPTAGVTFDADWRGVTRVEFSHSLHERIVIDDLRVAH